METGRGRFPDWGLEFGNPDLCSTRTAMERLGTALRQPKTSPRPSRRLFREGGVHLVDLPVDYSENQKVLIDELAEKVCFI